MNENPADLDDTHDTEEEVDGGEQHVLGLDNEAPTGPDEAGGGQGAVLGEREFLGGAGKVGDTGEDESPLRSSVECQQFGLKKLSELLIGKPYLHYGRPEMHRLETNRAIPHALEPAGLGSGLIPSSSALPPLAPLLAAVYLTERRGAGKGLTGLEGGGGRGEERPGGAGKGR